MKMAKKAGMPMHKAQKMEMEAGPKQRSMPMTAAVRKRNAKKKK